MAGQFAVPGPPPGAAVGVRVSPARMVGPDGTPPIETRLDFFRLTENPAAPGQFSGLSDPGPNAWSANLGVYYWQAVATWTDAANVFHTAGSPIEKLTIGTPPPTPVPSPGGGAGGAGAGGGGRATPPAASPHAPLLN